MTFDSLCINILLQAERRSNLLESLTQRKENQWRARQVNIKGKSMSSSFLNYRIGPIIWDLNSMKLKYTYAHMRTTL